MLLGNFICFNEEKILKFGAKIFLPLAIVFMMLVFFTVNFKIFSMDCSQLFKICAATMFFMLGLAISLNKPVPILSNAGRYLSMYIYIWHTLVGSLIKDLLTYFDAYQCIFDWVLPVAAVFTTIAVSILFAWITKNFKNKELKQI